MSSIPTGTASLGFVAGLRRRVEGTALFLPLRAAYRAVFQRARVRDNRQMRAFYGQFMGKGDLVFDIGAAVGEYAEVFCQLGARVVAVEPNPARCETLYKLSRIRDIRVEGCAVGATAGAANLHLCDEANFSTLSDRWIDRAAEAGSQVKWLGDIEVPVTTLDTLSKRHGVPRFVKIDVEGFEEHVLGGMTFQPAGLSFEFSLYVREAAYRCLRLPVMEGYEFNAIAGRDLSFNHAQWMRAEQMVEWIRSVKDVNYEYGDIFARRKPAVNGRA